MILLIDNYDSFVYNLYQLVGTIRPDTVVIRNDQLTIADIEKMAPDAIIISRVPENRRTPYLPGSHPPFCRKNPYIRRLHRIAVHLYRIRRSRYLCLPADARKNLPVTYEAAASSFRVCRIHFRQPDTTPCPPPVRTCRQSFA